MPPDLPEFLNTLRDALDPRRGRGIWGLGANIARNAQRNPLDALDFTPGLGDVKAAFIDAPLQAARGERGAAALSLASAVPIFGIPFDAMRAAARGRKPVTAAVRFGDEVSVAPPGQTHSDILDATGKNPQEIDQMFKDGTVEFGYADPDGGFVNTRDAGTQHGVMSSKDLGAFDVSEINPDSPLAPLRGDATSDIATEISGGQGPPPPGSIPAVRMSDGTILRHPEGHERAILDAEAQGRVSAEAMDADINNLQFGYETDQGFIESSYPSQFLRESGATPKVDYTDPSAFRQQFVDQVDDVPIPGSSIGATRQATETQRWFMENVPTNRSADFRRYQSTSFQGVNATLRGTTAGRNLPRDPEIMRHAERLQEQVNQAPPLSQPMTVLRGYRGTDLQVGDVLEDPGFTSTTARADVAGIFSGAGGSHRNIMRIELPEGTRGLWSDDASEAEFLLGTDTNRFRVVDVQEIPTEQATEAWGIPRGMASILRAETTPVRLYTLEVVK